MKQILLSALVVCVFGCSANAAVVTGVVKDVKTSAIIAGQIIIVEDSFFTFYIKAVTNSSGVYTATIPAGTAVGTRLRVHTNACNRSAYTMHTYTGSNLTVDFNLCPSPYPYILQGRFATGSLVSNQGPATVYLIRKQYDAALMDTTLVAIDSMQANYGYVDFGKYYDTIPSGTLYLKVGLGSSNPNYASYPPAYHDSSLKWNGATPLTNRSFISDTTGVLMKPGVNPGGPAFISGSVLQGANKSGAVGDPLNHRILILTTMAKQPVAYTYSNASGQFSFSNLDYGTYLLFGDALGKSNPELVVTLTPSQSSVTDVLFQENDKEFKGSSVTLSVVPAALGEVSVAPNPVSDIIHVNGLETIRGDKTLILMDGRGGVVVRKVVRAGEIATMDASQLTSGIYFIQVITDGGVGCFNVVK